MTTSSKLILISCLFLVAQIALGTAACYGILDSLFYVSPQTTLFESLLNAQTCIILFSTPYVAALALLLYLER